MSEPPSRHELFDAARQRAEWTVEQLWIHYLALGGTLLVFDVEAYLSGLMPMPPGQQDVLACALNERLADLYQAARVPYVCVPPGRLPRVDPLEAIEELRAATGHEDERRR
ncbi:MAG: hypothetical protein ACJ72G_15130 [Friedmanniella sp.]